MLQVYDCVIRAWCAGTS